MHAIVVPARGLIAWLFAAAAVELALCYAHAAYAMTQGLALRLAPAPWLSIDGEAALSAWFTSSLLLIAALLMLWTFAAERAVRRPTALGWLLLSMGFLYLSLDEMTAIHERLGELTAGLTSVWQIFTHRWVIIGLPVVLLAAIAFLPFLARLPRRSTVRLLVAGMLYVGGTVGLEMLNGAVMAAQSNASFSYELLVCLEETLEILGVVLGIRAVALHLETELASPALRFAAP